MRAKRKQHRKPPLSYSPGKLYQGPVSEAQELDLAMNAVDYFDSHADAFAGSYASSRDFRARMAIWTRLIERYAARSEDRRCIDLGCGPGLLSFHAAQCGLTTLGIDPSPRMLQRCEAEKRRRGLTNIHFRQGSLPLACSAELERVELVLCSSVMEYLPDWDAVMLGVRDLLMPGGHFLVSLPNGRSLYRLYEKAKFRLTGQPEYYRHVRHVMPASEAIEFFRRYGFTCQECCYYGDEPLLSRMASRCLPEPFSKNLYLLVLCKEAVLSSPGMKRLRAA